MGVLQASFQLHSGSEGEDKKGHQGRGIMIGRRVRAGQSQNCCWYWVKRAQREGSLLCTGPVSVRWTAGSTADLLHAWLLGWVSPTPFCPAGVCCSSQEHCAEVGAASFRFTVKDYCGI